jgi:hypothetical protein
MMDCGRHFGNSYNSFNKLLYDFRSFSHIYSDWRAQLKTYQTDSIGQDPSWCAASINSIKKRSYFLSNDLATLRYFDVWFRQEIAEVMMLIYSMSMADNTSRWSQVHV